jgi:hypothetical protein
MLPSKGTAIRSPWAIPARRAWRSQSVFSPDSLNALVKFLALLPFGIALATVAFKQGMKIASSIHTLPGSLQQLKLLIQFLQLNLFQNRESPLAIWRRTSQGRRSGPHQSQAPDQRASPDPWQRPGHKSHQNWNAGNLHHSSTNNLPSTKHKKAEKLRCQKPTKKLCINRDWP